jgi:hypothetical protein
MRRLQNVEPDVTRHQGMPNLEGMILIEEDRIPEAVAVLEQGSQRFASLGASDYELKCALLACRALCRGGDPHEGVTCLSKIESSRVKDPNWMQPLIEADCRLEAGDAREARAAIARAADSGEKFGNNHAYLELFRGRLELLEGHARSAVNRLRPLAADARHRRWTALALDTELALGRAELAAGISGGRHRLTVLQEEAHRRGYVLIRRRAASVLADAR